MAIDTTMEGALKAHLDVSGVAVGGRWFHDEVSQLVRTLAKRETPVMRRRAEQGWRMRWGAMFACAVARAMASSLLEMLHSHGGDGRTPAAHKVEGDHHHTGLVG